MRFRNAAALLLALLGGCVADASVGYTAQPAYVAAPAPAPEPAPAPAPEYQEPAPAPEQAADVQVEAQVEAPEEEAPELVEVETNPGVQVVYNAEVPVFYSDSFYWRYDGGLWYRSSVHTGGWVAYNNPPERIRRIDRPTVYSHYRPSHYVPRASRPGYVPPRRTYREPGRTTTVRQPGYREPARTTTTRPAYENRGPVRTEPTRTTTTRPAYENRGPVRTEPTRTTPTRSGYENHGPVRTEPTRTTPTRSGYENHGPVRSEPARTTPTRSTTTRPSTPSRDKDDDKKTKRH